MPACHSWIAFHGDDHLFTSGRVGPGHITVQPPFHLESMQGQPLHFL